MINHYRAWLILLSAIILYSCQKSEKTLSAYEMIQASLENHGDPLADDLKLNLEIFCENGINRGQSLTADPPHEGYPIFSHFEIDRPNQREVAYHSNEFNGFVFENLDVLKNGQGRGHDFMSHTHFEINTVRLESHRYLPFRHVRSMLRDSATLVYEGLVEESGNRFHKISTGTEVPQTIYLDAETMLLRKVETTYINQPYGDGHVIRYFDNYADFSGLKLAQNVRSGSNYDSWGELYNDFEIRTLETSIEMPDSAEFTPLVNKHRLAELIELAPNVHMIENINKDEFGIYDYNVLVAEFEDFILVGEAPVSNAISELAIEMITERFPDKPIKYMVQSHHHQDHIGGLRTYVAIGAEIVTTKSNQGLYERVAKAEFSIRPDSLAKSPREIVFQFADEPWTVEDGMNKAEVMNIGPIPHVKDMLMIYFPEQKLIWQIDMIAHGEWSHESEPSRIMKSMIQERQWAVDVIAGVHGGVLQGEELREYLGD